MHVLTMIKYCYAVKQPKGLEGCIVRIMFWVWKKMEGKNDKIIRIEEIESKLFV